MKSPDPQSKAKPATTFIQRTSRIMCSYSPILDWGSKYNGRTFNALTAASILSKRTDKDVMEEAT
jgi:hypothetical protein